MKPHYDNSFLPVWVDMEEDDEWMDSGHRLLATWYTITFFFYHFMSEGEEIVLSTN